MRWLLTVCGLISLLIPGDAAAQRRARRVPIAERAVDKLRVRGGPTLYGCLLGRSADGSVQFAVRRAWLQSAARTLYEKEAEKELQNRRAAAELLRDRLQAWIDSEPEPARLVRSLQKEFRRIEMDLARQEEEPAATETRLMLLPIPRGEIRQSYVQPPGRRRLAVVAWTEELENVETRPAADLFKVLQQQNVDSGSRLIDLSEDLPRRPDSEQQWAARRAIVEHHFGRSLKFQGTGGFLVEAGDGAEAPEFARLMQQMLSEQLTKDLGDLLGTSAGTKAPADSPLAAATKKADERGLNAVVITRLEQNLQAKRVLVEKQFLAKMPGGDWRSVWRHVESADASKVDAEAEKELAEHPQVKQILETAELLGLPAGEAQIRTAIRFGAATSAALKEADERLFEFEKRYAGRLDRPLVLPSGF